MKLLALSIAAACLCSCAATRPVGRGLTTAALKVTTAACTPFEAVIDKEPPFPLPVKVPLVVVTWPVAVGGTGVGLILFVPGVLLSPDDF